MVPSPMLSFITNDNNPTSVGLAPGSTIHFGSLEFIVDHLGQISLSIPPPPQERDLGAMLVGMVHSGSPSLRTTLAESSDEDGATSSARGSLGSPGPRGCNMVTLTDPIITTQVLESTPALQTIPTVMVRTAVP
jgi:hypothetical protein